VLPPPFSPAQQATQRRRAARRALQQAQADLVRTKAQYDAGVASLSELQTAQLARDLAETELGGDTSAILRVRLRFAQEQLLQAESRFNTGLATQAELEKAKLAKDLAEARLSGDGKAK
jgi:outer membrane protein TolC